MGAGTGDADPRPPRLGARGRAARRGEHAELPPPADGSLVQKGETGQLREGEVEAIDPQVGDIHRVANAFADRISISIHVYGANIGAVERATYRDSGEERPFISGYANEVLPNLWNGVIRA